MTLKKTLKESIAADLSFRERHMCILRNPRSEKKLVPNRSQLLHGFNYLLAAKELDVSVSALHIDFFPSQKMNRSNGFFPASGLKGMLEEEKYCSVSTVFQALAAFLERFTGCSTNPVLSLVLSIYVDIVNLI